MNKNNEITKLSKDIMINISEGNLQLHNILLKASRLSLLLDIPKNVEVFKEWAKYAEQNQFVVETYKSNVTAARDRNTAVSSANPNQMVFNPIGNFAERGRLKQEAQKVVVYLAQYRTEAYNFAMGTHTKWQFGNTAQKIFEAKRAKIEPILLGVFPDINQRLNSIDQNINSTNPEDWMNAITSCRRLFADLADKLKPATTPEDNNKYKNRLYAIIQEATKSKTKGVMLKNLVDELKKRIDLTCNMTQGAAHTEKTTLQYAQDTVLYTYLIVAEVAEAYAETHSVSADIVKT